MTFNEEEKHIKAHILNFLIAQSIPGVKFSLALEFFVDNRSNRADVVYIDDMIWAFEIKTQRDSLARLREQVYSYMKYCEKVTVVCHQKHIPRIRQILPKGVGLWCYRFSPEGIPETSSIRITRARSIRKKTTNLTLLRVHDLRKIVNEACQFRNISRRHDLEECVSKLKADYLRSQAIRYVRLKYDGQTQRFLRKINGRSAVASDLVSLSGHREFVSYEYLDAFNLRNPLQEPAAPQTQHSSVAPSGG